MSICACADSECQRDVMRVTWCDLKSVVVVVTRRPFLNDLSCKKGEGGTTGFYDNNYYSLWLLPKMIAITNKKQKQS